MNGAPGEFPKIVIVVMSRLLFARFWSEPDASSAGVRIATQNVLSGRRGSQGCEERFRGGTGTALPRGTPPGVAGPEEAGRQVIFGSAAVIV